MHIKIEYTRIQAQESLEDIASDFLPNETVEETLENFPWEPFLGGTHSQEDLCRLNVVIDPKSCLGRVAICFAIIDRFFPTEVEKYQYGEVTVDWFWLVLMNQWKNHYSSDGRELPDGWIDELLMYEEPHGIIVSDHAYQFEPLSIMTGPQNVWHPGASTFSPWSAITSALVVSHAILEQDPQEKIRILDEAEEICPNTCLVKQNRVEPLILLNRYDEAKNYLNEVIALRPNSRSFFVLESFFGEKSEVCQRLYGQRLWGKIRNRLEKEVYGSQH